MTKKPPKPSTSRFVDAAEVCADLGICKRTLTRWIAEGRFPAPMRLGLRRRVWLKTEVEVFYQAKSAEAARETAQ